MKIVSISRRSLSTDAIPALIINLNRDASRWRSISGALGQFGIPYQRISAVDARKHIGLIRRVVHRNFKYVPENRPLTDSEIGCYLSHVSALKRIVRQKLPMAMIFEDDVVFDDAFSKFHARDLPRYLQMSDIVKFEGIHYSHTSRSGIFVAAGETSQLILRVKPTLGAAAYAVTNNGARTLIKALSRTDRPFDHKLAYYDRHWVDYAETEPFLASQASYESNLEPERQLFDRDNRPMLKLKRFQHRLGSASRGALRLAYIAKFLIKHRLRKAKPASAT